MRVWLSCLILAMSAVETQAALEPSATGNEVQIPSEFVQKFISNDKCASSLKYRRSCLAALKAAAEMMSNPVPVTDAPTLNFEKALEQLTQSMDADLYARAMVAALNAHMQVFDSHARLESEVEWMAHFDKEQSVGGIGVTLQIYAGRLRVKTVLPGSPAEAGGLQSGDTFVSAKDLQGKPIKVDGLKNTDDSDIGGPVNSWFEFEVQRDGRVIPFRLQRKNINIAHVDVKLEGDVGILNVKNMAVNTTCEDIKGDLNYLVSKGAKKLVLDLRNNPGGHVRVGVCAAGIFLGAKNIVRIVPMKHGIPGLTSITGPGPSAEDIVETEGPISNNERKKGWIASSDNALTQLLVVVLIDDDTGSAAEILAGALQFYGRAWLVGTRTYGKGTIQRGESIHNFAPNMNVVQTTNHWLLPSGRSVQGVGLKPDFALPLLPGEDVRQIRTNHESEFPADLPLVDKRNPRRQEIKALRGCVAQTQTDLDLFAKTKAAGRTDYHMAYAQALLECEISKESAVLRH